LGAASGWVTVLRPIYSPTGSRPRCAEEPTPLSTGTAAAQPHTLTARRLDPGRGRRRRLLGHVRSSSTRRPRSSRLGLISQGRSSISARHAAGASPVRPGVGVPRIPRDSEFLQRR